RYHLPPGSSSTTPHEVHQLQAISLLESHLLVRPPGHHPMIPLHGHPSRRELQSSKQFGDRRSGGNLLVLPVQYHSHWLNAGIHRGAPATSTRPAHRRGSHAGERRHPPLPCAGVGRWSGIRPWPRISPPPASPACRGE